MSNKATMKNIKDFYILGLPIETQVGNIAFMKVKDYPNYHECLNVIRMTKDHIVKMYYENGVDQETLDALRELTLYKMVLISEDIRSYYIKALSKVLDKSSNIFDWGEDVFNDVRQILLATCVIKEEKINPNPEIQAWIDKSNRFKASMGGDLEFSDIVTSVAVGCGYNYDEVNDLTIFQLYNHFYRVAQFKNYDTSTLFATVASDKIDIDSWSKNIDVLKDEKQGLTKEEFDKMSGNIF